MNKFLNRVVFGALILIILTSLFVFGNSFWHLIFVNTLIIILNIELRGMFLKNMSKLLKLYFTIIDVLVAMTTIFLIDNTVSQVAILSLVSILKFSFNSFTPSNRGTLDIDHALDDKKEKYFKFRVPFTNTNFKEWSLYSLSSLYFTAALVLTLIAPHIFKRTVFMKDITYGYFIIVLAIIFSTISDTSAYILGNLIGRTKFTSISPNKTLEGVFGSYISSVAIAGALSFVINISFLESFIISFVATSLAIVGDLLQSKMKRYCEIKDSSKLLGAHGGVLDRIDSFTPVMIFLFLYFLIKRI